MAEFPEGLKQPDTRSCGAACLVVAQGLRDATYRQRVSDPATFRVEVLAMHGRITSSVDVSGRIQPPWPRDLGTPPWAVANQLAGTTRVGHRSVPMRWRDGDDCFDMLVDLPRPAVLYVGSDWLPRHVVLVLEGNSRRLRVYEPARGDVATVVRDAFTEQRLRLAGWDARWFAVIPER